MAEARTFARAVILGARGRYLSSWALLREPLDAPALTLRGSHLRQIGAPGAAQECDALALVHARSGVDSADAGLGWAADALALGRIGLAEQRWSDVFDTAVAAEQRTAVRAHWVGAEISLAQGDVAGSLRHAHAAVDLSARVSDRHLAKSLMILAAADTVGGDNALAQPVMERADHIIEQHRWLSLWWPWTLIAEQMHGVAERYKADRAWWAVRTIAAHLPEELAAAWMRQADVRRIGEVLGRYPSTHD